MLSPAAADEEGNSPQRLAIPRVWFCLERPFDTVHQEGNHPGELWTKKDIEPVGNPQEGQSESWR